MILFPNCKINLGLNIIGKRSDGYHDLETIFYPIPLNDIIEVITSDTFQFKTSGLQLPGKDESNLCVRAYELLKEDFPVLQSLYMHLHKHIPVGGGLGGGSADGAFMLKLLNDKFNLGLSTEQLLNYSLQLGSDCPFFILNKVCVANGRGELLEPVQLDLSGYSLALIHPGIHINTAWAFSKIIPSQPAKPVQKIILQPIARWRSELVNDFEEPVFTEYPHLKIIKEKLYEAGAIYASMTGSGSSLYGIFPEKPIHLSKTFNNYDLTFI